MNDSPTKKDDRQEVSPHEDVQKSVVLHEARVFSAAQINPRQCCRVLIKILYLIVMGEKFSSDEATGVFFGVTKLFQSQNADLRRIVYLVIKELSKNQDNVFVVINCLSKDITGNVDLFRANAIRVIARVIDASMIGTMERFLKQAIVDRNPSIASAALVTGHHLFQIAPDTIKRWANEIQDALTSKHRMVQYHALSLLHTIKKHDRLAISKVVASLCRRPPKSPLAQCLLIRFISGLLHVEMDKTLVNFLVSSLHHRSSMVMYEAARVFCFLPEAESSHITSSIAVLQEFLNSSIPAQRFAGVRTLAQVVERYPVYVTPCSVDLEALIVDANRNIATLAVTTLLKTGVESRVDHLMKSITGFMADISDKLRIVLVDAIRVLSLKFPHKHVTFMNFLSSVLREEGGLGFKTAIVDTILLLMNEIEDAKEAGLEHLCEFIEDCEFPTLSVRVLFVVGQEGPNTNNPAKYIRFIFNRVILETPSVRAAAVQTLARFGASCPSLLNSIIILLKRSLMDNDDEVRDRATFCLNTLEGTGEAGCQDILQGVETSWTNLEYSLGVYLQQTNDIAFAMTDVVELAPPTPGESQPSTPKATHHGMSGISSTSINPQIEQLKAIPEFAALGQIFRSSSPIDLTESEAEYFVRVIKHTYPEHILLQFDITNYMEGQTLHNVTVDLETNGDWLEEMVVPANQVEFEVGNVAYVCLRRPNATYCCDPMPGTLKFAVRSVDADEFDEGDEDEYELEDIEVSIVDFIRPHDPIEFAVFRHQWESNDNSTEFLKKIHLGVNDMQTAVRNVLTQLHMRAIGHSDEVADGARTHPLYLVGEFIGEYTVMSRVGFMSADNGVALKIAMRSPSQQLSEMLVNVIH